MNDNSKEILNGLYEEFEQERNEFQLKLDDNAARVEIIEDNIHELMQYDDDRQMFSPRNISGTNSDKIDELRVERDTLLEENQYISSKLKYFEDKTDALKTAIDQASVRSYSDATFEDEGIKDSKANILISKNRLKNIIYKLELAQKLVETEPRKSKSEIDSVISQFSKLI